MKCKLSKLFFLALIGAVSVNGYSQSETQRKKISQSYDTKKLKKLKDRFNNEYQVNYTKALEVAKNKNLPLDGVDENGSYFSLKGIDDVTGNLLYYKTSNNGDANSSVQTARAQHLYNGGSLGLNIQGQGMLLGIWDGGQPQASHPNLGLGRVTNKDGQTVTSTDPTRQQQGIDHATHVAGTMVGNGSFQIAARGIAFDAYLWSNTWTNDITEMTDQAEQGLLVSNHSYGINNEAYLNDPGHFGRYTNDSQEVDELTNEARFYLPVYAAGNDRQGVGFPPVPLNPSRSGRDLMSNETVAKNPVVVAAVNGITNYVFNGYEINNVQLTNFSQGGPTDDFRVKPDISAKGFGVFSSNMPTANSANSYGSENGTSMAAPAVSGVFILWQQYFNQLWPNSNLNSVAPGFMKAASVKALMAHTASEAGFFEGPDEDYGWGLINAQGGAQLMKDASEGTAYFKELNLQNGTEFIMEVTIDGTQPLTATISWTDKEAESTTATNNSQSLLVNDLDLRILTPGEVEAFPYSFNKSWNSLYVTKDVDNDSDVIEKVVYYDEFMPNAAAGTYRIKVSHKGNLDLGNQDFTLAVSGGVVSFSDGDVSVDKVEFENLKIYPNPATDVLNIASDFATLENAKITIYDILGKKVYQNDSLFNFTGEASIDVSSFNKGVYLVEILKDRKAETKKIIIK